MKFTVENAAEMARKAAASRREAALMRILCPPPREEPNFADIVLNRVRAQMDLINARLTEALKMKRPDPQAIDRLAAAQSRLSEQERILAGRPMPGSLRPASAKSGNRRAEIASSPSEIASQDSGPKHDPDEPNG